MNQSNRDASQAPENDRGTNIGQDAELPIRKAPINGPVPVSFVQERLWLFEQLRPGNYNSCFAVRIVGNLNVKALHDSFTEMLRRHESLRTNYRLLDGQLAQIINPPMAFPQSIIDYSKIAEAKREIQVSAFIHEDYRRPFDLSRDLLFRSSLLQLAPEIHVLIITRHHLLCDEWSMGIFFQELSALYENFSLGKSSNLPEPEIQFADFAWWQRNSFLETERASHLSYWKEQLCDRLPELHLPGEESKVPAQIFRGARYSILLPKRLSDRLKRLSRREAVSLSDLMLAAFQTLLYRYTGELNIAVGSPVPNRSRSKLQGLIGCVSNTLILCADLSGNPTFRELMGRVKRVAQQAKDHQDIPFEIVVRELGSRQAGQYELPIRIMFSHQEPEFYIPKLAGLTVSPMDSLGMIANLDLTLQSMVTEQGLTISLGYNGAQLNDDAVSRMLGHLKVLLMGIVKDPDDRISTLPILSAKERRQILYGWNDTKKNYPNDRCLHQHFESQVERTPNEPAVIFEDKQLTFLELNQRANQLGHYLVGLGVEPGQVVALCMRRSIEMATGILGILKAGGACLLLDPALPPDRKSFMLNDADVTAMLIQRSVLDRLPAHSAHLVNLDTSGKSIAKESEENLNTGVSANHAACVVYTSGSTGAPKGLVLSHTSACSSFLPETALHRLTAADRYLATTYSFMMPDIFWPWLAGARAVMATDEGYGDSGYLVRLIAEQQITFSCIVPSMLQALLEEESIESCASLRHVIVTGEPLTSELQDRFLGLLPAELHNAYGQAEAGSTIWKCERGNSQMLAPIGRPAANTEIYILDPCLQPVPIGVPGEIYIHSANMALEYLNLPDLTVEKFIPNPFSNENNALLYKTGDLARYLPDGNIDFLGRNDSQVKIRGLRIELGEIEAVLIQHKEVQKTVVIDREDVSGKKRLVAYLVSVEEQAPTINDLRRFLKKKLPDHMIPSAFVFLESIPQLPNGKADRLNLPTPAQVRPELERAAVAPRTLVEGTIADIWADLLDLDQVGIYDDFFELGGNSLLAVQALARVREIFSVEYTLRDFFESSTSASIAEQVEKKLLEEPSSQMPPVLRLSQQVDLPLSFAQERVWSFEQVIPGTPILNMPIALRLKGPLNITAMRQAFDSIVQRHGVLRSTYAIVEGRTNQVVMPAETFQVHEVDLSGLPSIEREAQALRLAAEEAISPFDIARGPILRVTIVHLSNIEHHLLLTLHHIAGDQWSLGVLSSELSTFYQAFSGGSPTELADLPIQYSDYAYWQRRCVREGEFDEQFSYWKGQLSGKPIAIGRSREAEAQSFQASHKTLEIPPELCQTLKNLKRNEGYTLFIKLLSAIKILMYHQTGQEDIVVTTRVANRNRSETHGIIGLFLNVLLLRTDLSENPTLREVLRRVRGTTLDGLVNQDLPFELLVQMLESGGEFDRSSISRVMFILEESPMKNLQLPGLDVDHLLPANEMAGIDLRVTTFDLTFIFREDGDRLTGTVIYKNEVYDSSAIDHILENLQKVLETMVSKPQLRLKSLFTETDIC